ncbi:MAG TPA: ATP-binding protein [Acidobacteriaceae bacterium]|nr:ATP-binding protein [Acidobacteriaceae bacterium]
MSWLKPRSIRGQLISRLILLEGLLVIIFAVLLVREQASEVHERARRRLESEVNLLVLQSQDSLTQGAAGYLEPILRTMVNSPEIRAAMVTDTNGRIIAAGDPSAVGKDLLTRLEKKQMTDTPRANIFRVPGGAREAVQAIHVGGQLSGFAWVYEDATAARQQIYSLIRITFIFAGLGALGTAIIAGTLARSITRPLHALLAATRKLIRDPETKEGFPLEVTSANESADLTRAFNLMVTSMEEQRSGLSDTLALLDSMLENAPIGFAFFDRKFRYVRVNQFLAEMNQAPIGRHLGRTIAEMLPGPPAELLQDSVQRVFETGQTVIQLELDTPVSDHPTEVRNWLINVYPVKATSEAVRWVGAIAVEATERKQAEDALRKTEKLAAAGRLAASIAHEINNPLEAVTNLLYLLRHHSSLDREAADYADLAQQEISRVAEMTQQTLRFYRQATLPAVANIGELLSSVLTVYAGRLAAAQIEVSRNCGPHLDLYCFSGEMRQLFANLIGNAIDAIGHRGHLWLSVRHSRSWVDGTEGIRLFVADNGCGMTPETKARIFEPFFTTKETTGTGLGLWVSGEIIAKHKGTVRVASRAAEPGSRKPSGTVFMLFFPEGGIGVPSTPTPAAVTTQSA